MPSWSQGQLPAEQPIKFVFVKCASDSPVPNVEGSTARFGMQHVKIGDYPMYTFMTMSAVRAPF